MLFFDKETLCTLLTIFFLTYYFSPEKLRQFYYKFALVASKEEIDNSRDVDINVALLGEEPEPEPEPKYTDKYLEYIKKMNQDFVFDEKEKELEKSKTNEFFLLAKNEAYERIKETKDKLGYIETQLAEYKEYDLNNPNNSLILAQQNAGNIDVLKKQVEKLLPLNGKVQDLSGNVTNLSQQINSLIQTQQQYAQSVSSIKV